MRIFASASQRKLAWNHQQNEKATMEWENIFANSTSEKELKYTKYLRQLNNNNTKAPEVEFLPKSHADGPKIYETMLNVTNYWGNKNQNHSELPPHTTCNDYHQEVTTWQVVEEREPLHTVGGNVNWCRLCEKQ